MRTTVLACLYPFVKEAADAPFSVRLVAGSTGCEDEHEVAKVFRELKAEGMITRKHYFTSVYRFTDKGIEAAKEAYESSRSVNDEAI